MSEQWAAGAPVIGAAPVSAGRPNWPRSEGLPGNGDLQFSLKRKGRPARRKRFLDRAGVTKHLPNYKQSLGPRNQERVTNSKAPRDSRTLTLSFELAFDDLFTHEGLAKLDRIFLGQLQEAAPE